MDADLQFKLQMRFDHRPDAQRLKVLTDNDQTRTSAELNG
jgi:hypothetical protein